MHPGVNNYLLTPTYVESQYCLLTKLLSCSGLYKPSKCIHGCKTLLKWAEPPWLSTNSIFYYIIICLVGSSINHLLCIKSHTTDEDSWDLCHLYLVVCWVVCYSYHRQKQWTYKIVDDTNCRLDFVSIGFFARNCLHWACTKWSRMLSGLCEETCVSNRIL